MKLVTLEGLPTSCDDILKNIQHHRHWAVVPTPVVPAPTSHVTSGEEVAMVLSNVIARMKLLQRTPGDIVCGAHWIETPPLSMDSRRLVHRIAAEMMVALADALSLTIEHHTVVMTSMNPHECFEQLITSMEARDLTLNDILEESVFFDTLTVPSPFPYSIKILQCPPNMISNQFDVAVMVSKVTAILRSVS